MSTYSIGSDSPRWWWPSAAAGVAGAAAIAAILVLPASSSTTSGPTPPDAPPAPVSDPWFSTVDPSVGRQCFALPARSNSPRVRPTPVRAAPSHRAVGRHRRNPPRPGRPTLRHMSGSDTGWVPAGGMVAGSGLGTPAPSTGEPS